MLIKAPIRIVDNWGRGDYGAPRGSRKHKGKDFCCAPGSEILAHKHGRVTKIGYPYDDDEDHDGKPDYTYVEIEDPRGNKCRYFYVKPLVTVGDMIATGQLIGTSQALGPKYDGISEHVHIEVKDKDGVFFDPEDYGL